MSQDNDATKPRRLFRIRLRDRVAEAAKRRAAEQIQVKLTDKLPEKDVAGYDPYGHTKRTPRFQPGERGRVNPVELGGNIQPNDPFRSVGKRRG